MNWFFSLWSYRPYERLVLRRERYSTNFVINIYEKRMFDMEAYKIHHFINFISCELTSSFFVLENVMASWIANFCIIRFIFNVIGIENEPHFFSLRVIGSPQQKNPHFLDFVVWVFFMWKKCLNWGCSSNKLLSKTVSSGFSFSSVSIASTMKHLVSNFICFL